MILHWALQSKQEVVNDLISQSFLYLRMYQYATLCELSDHIVFCQNWISINVNDKIYACAINAALEVKRHPSGANSIIDSCKRTTVTVVLIENFNPG